MSPTDGGNDDVETEKRPAEAGDATEPASKRPNTEEEPKPGDAVDPKTLSHLTNPTRNDYFINKVNQYLSEYQQIKEKVPVDVFCWPMFVRVIFVLALQGFEVGNFSFLKFLRISY